MHIKHISVKNFRLLANVDLTLEQRTTVIVGRNNSGKTSLTELFRRLLSENTPTFRLEDFSLSVHDDFWKAFLLKQKGAEESKIRQALPIIEVGLTVAYEKDAPSLGMLSEFIVDLNPERTDALIILRYQLKDGEVEAFFKALDVDQTKGEIDQKTKLCRDLRERVLKYYTTSVLAVDPGDPNNQKPVEFSALGMLVLSGFVNAQRGLDDTTHKDINLLGKILGNLLKLAENASANKDDGAVAKNLDSAVNRIQDDIDDDFNKHLQELIPAFQLFGYPGLSDPRLRTETTLDVEGLLKNHTKVNYEGVNGINLPEAYNGLGVRNLIFILLKLYEFFKSFKVQGGAPGIHLVFIEEPEVHLHPQMQEVFIDQLGAIADEFSRIFNSGNPWPVQFVVTTHSSHLANRAPFASVRYFLSTSDGRADGVRFTRIKDLRNGMVGTPQENQEFLRKYMTLTRCDLLFADKAVLIEGTSERLLFPSMIKKVDVGKPVGLRLSSQYVSVVEVGGAYAHFFFGLLDFLELRTLIITDLDAVNQANSGKACRVSEGTNTSNDCIKKWFGDAAITPQSLIQKSDEEKTKDIRRLAYQVPETNGAACGRSFEDAFILANGVLFSLPTATETEREARALDKAKGVGRKSDFALKFAIEEPNWVVPRYIAEGLSWLSEAVHAPAMTPSPESTALTVAEPIPPEQEESHE